MISYKKFEEEELSKQQEIFLKSVKRASVDNVSFVVCLALKSDEDIFFLQDNNQFNDYEYYQTILTSGQVKNSYVIPLRDKEKKNFGFIQLINSKKNIDHEHDIQPFKNALLGLVQIIINNRKNQQELIKKENLLKDADFYNLMQNKRYNVNELLDGIMKYFSKEFNAAVISFRIPVLNGYKHEPLFYLRRIFVHTSIGDNNRNKLINHYRSERLVKHKDEICGIDELRCDSHGKIFEGKSESDFSGYGLHLDNNTLIMPILSDLDQKCIHLNKTKIDQCQTCNERFKRLYGIFRLRILKSELSNNDSIYRFNPEETKTRLAYLSKQITLLFNSIVDKHENESLKQFQVELRNSSFIKIKDFDERCVEIIRNSVHAKICSIYRYNNQTKRLTLSATTAERIQFIINQMPMFFPVAQVLNSCFISSEATNNMIAKTYNNHPYSLYVFNIYDPSIHKSAFLERVNRANDRESAFAVPMTNKDGSCAGVVFLLGKEENKHPTISTSYWEHDVKHIEFIVNILTRISESDTERLTFLSRLSHELLAPVTELVYDNDLTVNIAVRNRETFSRQLLINKLLENIDRNMIFKYIVSDTEFIYSSSGKLVDYNIVKQEKPQNVLLNAVRLLEKDANYKGLSIRTNISEMPALFFDKERMMQVFINLLKNAIRYSNDGTTINIYYKFENNIHEIRFTNYGIGIQEEEKEAIFELFYRGETVKKNFIRGTGMGLYIVRDIMRAHRGDCYVRNLNNPTEFVITLPEK